MRVLSLSLATQSQISCSLTRTDPRCKSHSDILDVLTATLVKKDGPLFVLTRFTRRRRGPMCLVSINIIYL